jgi:hypothetical protein
MKVFFSELKQTLFKDLRLIDHIQLSDFNFYFQKKTLYPFCFIYRIYCCIFNKQYVAVRDLQIIRYNKKIRKKKRFFHSFVLIGKYFYDSL